MVSRWGRSLGWGLILFASGCVLSELELVTEPTDAEACTECASSQCSTAYESCYGQTACETLVNCALQCSVGDTDCATACATASPDGVDAATVLFDCTTQACPEDCGSWSL